MAKWISIPEPVEVFHINHMLAKLLQPTPFGLCVEWRNPFWAGCGHIGFVDRLLNCAVLTGGAPSKVVSGWREKGRGGKHLEPEHSILISKYCYCYVRATVQWHYYISPYVHHIQAHTMHFVGRFLCCSFPSFVISERYHMNIRLLESFSPWIIHKCVWNEWRMPAWNRMFSLRNGGFHNFLSLA